MGSAVTISGVARRTRTMEKRPCGRAACRTYNPSLFKAPSLSHYAMQAASGPDKLSDAAAERRRGYDHPQRQHHHHHRSKNPAFRPIRNSSGRSAGSREGDQAPVRQQVLSSGWRRRWTGRQRRTRITLQRVARRNTDAWTQQANELA